MRKAGLRRSSELVYLASCMIGYVGIYMAIDIITYQHIMLTVVASATAQSVAVRGVVAMLVFAQLVAASGIIYAWHRAVQIWIGPEYFMTADLSITMRALLAMSVLGCSAVAQLVVTVIAMQLIGNLIPM